MCLVTPEGSFLYPSSSLSLFSDSVVAVLSIDSHGSRSVVDMHRVPQGSGGIGLTRLITVCELFLFRKVRGIRVGF